MRFLFCCGLMLSLSAFSAHAAVLKQAGNWTVASVQLTSSKVCGLQWLNDTNKDQFSLTFDGHNYRWYLAGIGPAVPSNTVNVKLLTQVIGVKFAFKSGTGAASHVYDRYVSEENAIGLLDRMMTEETQTFLWEASGWNVNIQGNTPEIAAAMKDCIVALKAEMADDPSVNASVSARLNPTDEEGHSLWVATKVENELWAGYLYWSLLKDCSEHGWVFNANDTQRSEQVVIDIISANNITKKTANFVWEKVSPQINAGMARTPTGCRDTARMLASTITRYLEKPSVAADNPFTK